MLFPHDHEDPGPLSGHDDNSRILDLSARHRSKTITLNALKP